MSRRVLRILRDCDMLLFDLRNSLPDADYIVLCRYTIFAWQTEQSCQEAMQLFRHLQKVCKEKYGSIEKAPSDVWLSIQRHGHTARHARSTRQANIQAIYALKKSCRALLEHSSLPISYLYNFTSIFLTFFVFGSERLE